MGPYTCHVSYIHNTKDIYSVLWMTSIMIYYDSLGIT